MNLLNSAKLAGCTAKSNGCAIAAPASPIRIARAPFVDGEVIVANMGGTTVAEVRDPNSQTASSKIPALYEVKLTSMHPGKMLLKGEERPQGNTGPAYV